MARRAARPPRLQQPVGGQRDGRAGQAAAWWRHQPRGPEGDGRLSAIIEAHVPPPTEEKLTPV